MAAVYREPAPGPSPVRPGRAGPILWPSGPPTPGRYNLPVLHRFYAPDLAPGPDGVRLPAEEADHLARVLRLKAGDEILVFDGRGREFLARVASAGRDGARVELVEPRPAVPEPAVAVTLAQAVLKSDKMDRVVRDAVMLGVSAVRPLWSARTEVPAAALRNRARAERWQRVAVASAKQCGRAVVPPVWEPVDLAALLAGDRSEIRVILVEPGGGPGPGPGADFLRASPRPSSATVLIGPEGGWAPEEAEAARGAGFLPVTLGARTLRADAAGAAAVPILLFAWGDL